MFLRSSVLLVILFLGACLTSNKGTDAKYSKPTDALKEDSYQGTVILAGPVFVATRKAATRKISGRIYCGEGMRQTPANKATVEIQNKNKNVDKVVRSTTTEADGTYAFSSTFELDGEYSYVIKARCGQITSALPKDLTNDLTNQDFWIK